MKSKDKCKVIPIRKDMKKIDNTKKADTIEESFENLTKFVEELINGHKS